MKNLILASFVLSCLLVNGQTIKKAKQQVTLTKTIVSEEEVVKLKAEEWFKNVYVESVFKDPYSYKLLKTIVTSKTIKESISDSIAIISQSIDTCTLSYKDKGDEGRKEWQDFYDETKKKLDKDTETLNLQTDSREIEYYTQRCAIYRKYAIQALETLKRIDLYHLDNREKQNLQNRLSNLTIEQENQIAFYEIRIDCYSNNSFGNQILGRFSFPFTNNGPIGLNNGIDQVTHLNKE
jgi:hypothetical protein